MSEIMKFDLESNIGNDVGNHDTKMNIDGEKREQPTAILMTNRTPFSADVDPKSVLNNIWNNIFVTIDSPAVTPGMYHIGRSALDEGTPPDNLVLGDLKGRSHIPFVVTLGMIAAHAAQKFPEKDEINVRNDMGIALPVTQFDEEDARRYENSFMKDKEGQQAKHKVTLHLGARRVNVNIVFSFVRCVQEGMVACWTLAYTAEGKWRRNEDDLLKPLRALVPVEDGAILDGKAQDELQEKLEELFNIEIERQGKQWVDAKEPTHVYAKFSEHADGIQVKEIIPSGKYFAGRRILHIDIGDGTTELPVTKGVQPLHKFNYGINHGAGHALDEALPVFNKSIHVLDSPRQYLGTVIKDKKHKYHARAMNALVEPVTSESKQIRNGVIHQLRKTRGEIDCAVVYGGGSILLEREINPMLKEELEPREIFLFYVDKKYAIDLNSNGLYTFVISPVFKKMKKEYENQRGVSSGKKQEESV